MSARIRTVSLILVGVVLGVSLSMALAVTAREDSSEALSNSDIPLEELKSFSQILDRVKAQYVEPVDDRQLISHAIRGMLDGLDPHSAYLDKDQFKEMQVNTSGEFGGLGIEVQMEDGFVKVVSPIDDTPAARAGLESGDLIIRLNEQAVKGMSLNEAVDIMRGEPGTDITLTVVREGQDGPFTVDITRDIIQVESVKSRMLEQGFAYLRITQFRSDVASNFQKQVDQLRDEHGGELRGAVLDLRNNPGGVLNAAVNLADLLLDEGMVVYTKGRSEDSQQEFKASSGDILDGAPLVVLVNGGSASASEIVAGAIQDNGRGLVLGQQTFGKGSVQTLIPLPEGDALKLTTARYYTPSGRSIQAKGISPDITVTPAEVKIQKDNGLSAISEADLAGSLKGAKADGDKKSKGRKKDRDEAEGEEQKPLAERDYQLYEAVNLLKGLTMLEERRLAN